jgi:transposase-like protein
MRNASQFFDELSVKHSQVAVHNWVHKADLRPISMMSADQFAVDEKVNSTNGDDYWLYGAVDPQTNETLQLRLLLMATKQTTRRFLTELHRRNRPDSVEFLVDDADHLVDVLDEDGYRFQMISHGNRNAIESFI